MSNSLQVAKSYVKMCFKNKGTWIFYVKSTFVYFLGFFSISAVIKGSNSSREAPIDVPVIRPKQRPTKSIVKQPVSQHPSSVIPSMNQQTIPAELPAESESTPLASRLMLVDDNKTLKPVTKEDNVSALVHQLVNDDSMNSPQFQTALNTLCSVPIDVINHFAIIGEFTKHLKESNRMTDVQIQFKNKHYFVHRITLAYFSSYFRNIFLQQEAKYVPFEFDMDYLKNLNENGFNLFVKFVYSGELDLNEHTVADLLNVADILQVPHIETQCLDYTRNISVHQAIKILQLQIARQGILFRHAFNVVLQNFAGIDKHEAFFQLDVNMLCSLLRNDNLVVEREIEVFRIVRRWLLYDDSRQYHVLHIMNCIRFDLMSQLEVIQCATHTAELRNDSSFQNMIFKAYW